MKPEDIYGFKRAPVEKPTWVLESGPPPTLGDRLAVLWREVIVPAWWFALAVAIVITAVTP